MVSLSRRLTDLSIEQVQRWVLSLLVLAVSSFPLGALSATSIVLDQDGQHLESFGLVLPMAVLGCLAVAVVCRIHEHSWRTPWLLLGLAPAVTTALFVVA